MKCIGTRLTKALLTILLSCSLVLQGCALPTDTPSSNSTDETRGADTDLTQDTNRSALQDAVYQQLIDDLGDEAFIENVTSTYLSEEYIEELAFNSKENIYFDYSLADLDNVFQGQRYVFTVDEDGQTVVHEFELQDTTYEKALQDMAIGGGVILFCVTVSALTTSAAPAMSMVFAFSAKTAATDGVIAGGISAAIAAASTAAQTGNLEETLKAAAKTGAQGFKYAAITGAITGGAKEAAGLYGASRNGLTMNQAATIQREAKWSLD